MDIEALKIQYSEIVGRSERMREAVFDQLSSLLDDEDVTLGVPMESRVKDWSSIEEKIERKQIEVTDIKALPDIIGVRTILLFRTDLKKVDELVHQTFDVKSSEDASERLDEAQFGYQSSHYIIKLPETWLEVPSMADLGDLHVELQVRTLAQHIWAVASHKLQYKDEASVPPPIRRAIIRASALLETVDLEFERVLSERKDYLETGISEKTDTELLNVDLLSSILTENLPALNAKEDEPYEQLLRNLKAKNINTAGDLKKLISDQLEATIEEDEKIVRSKLAGSNYLGTSEARLKKGVFYNHAGLTRHMLRRAFRG